MLFIYLLLLLRYKKKTKKMWINVFILKWILVIFSLIDSEPSVCAHTTIENR